MINFVSRMPRSATVIAATLFAATLLTGSAAWTTRASASDSVVAATLAADALMAETAAGGASILAADATLVQTKIASADAIAAPVISDSIAKTALNANAAMPGIARRRAATAPVDRRITPTRTSWSCSGVWCGRHMVLMLGTAF